ncbi:pyrroloquinoline quinone biosynthesis protein PqqF [Pseudomonas cavernicola]|uniref:Coenzyme PQQ synthesis protein F n=1 Tax=Pseudomonas cavernicola TaxID=2320866 RepID=A0A418X886_9PSED|nr:pyrroloquinoline quinone biosynthesis protein PqqF [Pseudomonas cavernicola]RJG08670.1 pyrroloquinoline quinone biosynthesis protein PqqF [Pseudomonas cavernicola]
MPTKSRSSCADSHQAEPEQLVLANGLKVKLLQVPGAAQAAALVRVSAGSHDAPLAYPGLAHFLEHLLFLGSAQFAAENGLLAYVRACSGQVNASTRERSTDYFFEVPASRLEGGLARLCDMLVRPVVEPAAQLREREVLQAEFVARGRDRDTLCDAALGQAVASGHPFTAFHAGNRDTLAVEQPLFQQALQDFHRRFYHAGQISLVLVGPQSLAELRRLAQIQGALLHPALAVAQGAAPTLLPLRAQALRVQVPAGLPQLSVCFALEDLPAAFTSAVDFLGTWLCHEAGGGLLDTLRKCGWCDALQVRLPYRHAGQALLTIDFSLTESAVCARGAIRAALLDWLAFFAGQDDWLVLREEYAAIVRHQLGSLSPLALARYWSERQQGDCGLGEEGVRALRSLLAQLQPQRLIELTSDTQEIAAQRLLGFTLRMAEDRQEAAGSARWAWRLPAANPFLQPQASSAVAPPRFETLHWLNAPGESGTGAERGQGTIYLRWSFAAYAPPSALFEVLQVALRPAVQLALQAGLEVRFERQGKAWQLQASGAALALPSVLAGVAELLRSPPEWAWSQGLRQYREQARRGASEALIRQLWQRLPELFGAADEAAEEEMPTLQALVECWRQSSLQGLAVGLPIEARAALDSALWRMPGQARASTEPQLRPAGCYHWRDAGLAASESALLLFCPLPDQRAATEVAWRLLALLLESAFFQRLRSELQLGYAVFCGFRQVGTRQGLLFAVQSPTVDAAEILGHIEEFLAAQREHIAALDAACLSELRASLQEHLRSQSASVRGMAEHAWSALLAGQAGDRPRRLQEKLQTMQREDLLNHYQILLEAAGGWFVLANAACPDGRWHILD